LLIINLLEKIANYKLYWYPLALNLAENINKL